MDTLGIKKEDNTKKMANFQVTGPIKFVALKYSIYRSWNVKVDCKINVLDKLGNYLKSKNILGQNQEKINDLWITMLLTKSYIKDQIELIDNRDKKEQMESLYNTFSFIFDNIADSNPNPSHKIEEFW